MKHLIIGNGAAGITAAGKLRELRSSDTITVATAEPSTAYAKIMLPDYIGGKMEREKLFIRDKSYYDKNEINLFTNSKAVNINTKEKVVEFSNGMIEYYDELLIAVGGKPLIPCIEGIEQSGYYTINSLSDADAIKSEIKDGKSAVIIGGGLTGLEMAFALGRQGMKVYLIERGDTILPQQLDIDSSDIIANELRKLGVTVLASRTVSRILNKENSDFKNPTAAKQIELLEGEKIDFDMLILSIGTRPDIEFIKDAGIKSSRGILVDEYMRTSENNIYAAGDVAEVSEISSEYVSGYIWPNAMAQGKTAALNMSGQVSKLQVETYLQNMVQLRDIPFNSVGMVKPRNAECEVILQCDKTKGIYKRIVLMNNRIKGALFIGDISASRKISALIRNNTDVTSIKHKLLDEDF